MATKCLLEDITENEDEDSIDMHGSLFIDTNLEENAYGNNVE